MKFNIMRASQAGFGSEEKKPTDKAYKENDNWFVDINSLSELLELTREEGEIIIGKTYDWEEDGLRIMIYDDYLE